VEGIIIGRKQLVLWASVIALLAVICLTFATTIPEEVLALNREIATKQLPDIKFSELEVKQNEDGTQLLQVDDLPNVRMAGLPALPSKTISVPVPYYLKIENVTAECEWEKLEGTYRIECGQPPAPSTGEPVAKVEPNPDIYDSNKQFPEEAISLESIGEQRGKRIATIQINPVRYYPESGTVEFCKKLKPDIQFEIDMSHSSTPAPSDIDIADYVIITSDGLQIAVDPLKNYKELQGLSVQVQTIEWVDANVAGVDLQEKMRNYLRDNYLAWGTDYVLLVGLPSTVPMRTCHTPTGYGDTPTDYYYSDLSGDWDLNDDGDWGEYGVDDEPGGVDFYPEVYVGRIPTDVAGEITSICNKIVTFSQDNGAWKNDALLLGAVSNFENQNGSGWPATWGSYWTEELKGDFLNGAGINSTTMHERSGLVRGTPPISPDPNPGDLGISNTRNQWQANDYGIVTWWAHGSSTGAYRTYWNSDDGDEVPESPEISQPTFLSSADAPSMDNLHPPIVFAVACNNSRPETANSMNKEYIKNGASAFVSGTRVTWYSIGWEEYFYGGNATIGYHFYENLVVDGDRVGKALRDSLVKYKEDYCWWGHSSYQNLYGFNLTGDPSMKLEAEGGPLVGDIDPDEKVTGESFGATITGSNFITGAEAKLVKGPDEIEATGESVDSSTEITCNFDLTGADDGNWDVVVTNPDLQFDSLPAGFTILLATQPTITQVWPEEWENDEAVYVSIEGTNFVDGIEATLKKAEQPDIDGTDVQYTYPTQIVCCFDLNGVVIGDWDVYVENPSTENYTLENGFTVTESLPTVTSIDPNEGMAEENVDVTITGNNFGVGAEVKIVKGGSEIVGTSTIANPTKIISNIDLVGADTSDWDVVVTNPSGGRVSLDRL